MEQVNRFMDYSNRTYQIVEGKDDYVMQLAVVRSIAKSNYNEVGVIMPRMSDRVGDVTFTVVVELLQQGRKGQLRRITCFGSLAEEVAEMKLTKGDIIAFSGKFNEGSATIEGGRLARRPYVIASWFELKEKAEPTSGMAHIDEKGGIEPLPGEKLQKVGE